MKQDNLNISYEEFVQLKQKFEEKEKKIEAQLWVDSTLNKFDELLRVNYAKSLEEFSQIVIQHIAELTNAFSGIMYTLDKENKVFKASAGYAIEIDKLEKRVFKEGEGAVGQAVASAKTLLFENIPADSVEVYFGSAKVNVANIRVIPLVFNEIVFGALELVYITNVSEVYARLLEKISRSIATMIESILNNDFNQKLLVDSQEQTDLLRAQEEELRQNLEEIAATQDLMNKQQKELEQKEMDMSETLKKIAKEKQDIEENEKKMKDTVEKYQQDIKRYQEKDKVIEQLKAELATYRKAKSTTPKPEKI
ncbi:GAF domain-containing protein [Microscilla marina]|uniref:GAF domain protein n=1 Tax=Microscilla marina ATCC 23134 TaxID=313606 RepID=A1ZZ43_MICM2|nr:GAF domain-containing protein [Microscilla marina]EAY24365.1 GAF domain protein [Microscilla marina ATCC 23134]